MERLRKFLARRARLLLVFTAGAAAVGYTGSWHWTAELFSHFFFQYWMAALFACAVLWWAGDRRWGVAAAVLLGVFSFSLAPFFLGDNVVSAAGAHAGVRLLQFNAAQNPGPVFDWLANNPNEADVLVMLEATPDFQDGIRRLERVFPHSAARLEHGPFGIALLSKYPLDGVEILDLAGEDYPALAASVAPRGWPTPLRLHAIHPPPPVSPELAAARNRYLERLAARIAGQAGPVVVAGDANATPWSPWFRAFLRDSGLRDSQHRLGLLSTWPAVTAGYSSLLGIPIDACLVSQSLDVVARHAGPPLGSDHLPVTTELRLR